MSTRRTLPLPQAPYGVQGGQAGQHSVSLNFCKDPMINGTVQIQRDKGNVVIKESAPCLKLSLSLLPDAEERLVLTDSIIRRKVPCRYKVEYGAACPAEVGFRCFHQRCEKGAAGLGCLV